MYNQGTGDSYKYVDHSIFTSSDNYLKSKQRLEGIEY
jgi:hypothetical protein